MRDFVVLAFIFLSAPMSLFSPYYGILIWYFIAFLNPHRFAWNIAFSFPVAMVIGIPTLVGAFFAKETNRKVLTRENVILFLMWVWFCVTIFHASQVPFLSTHLHDGLLKLSKVSKILLMTFATFYLVSSKQKLRWLLLLVAFCFIFLDGKGAIWGVATGGQYRVYGPEESFIEDNNAFGLATNMVMPLMFFLAWDEKRRWVRFLLRFGFVSGIVAVMLTYSRGGLLGLAVVLGGVAIKANRKLIAACLLGIVVLGALVYSPEKWQQRMAAFMQGNVDDSALERLITWQVGLRIVEDFPLFGGGFEVYPDVPVFQHYKPRDMPGGRLSAGPHSIYFEMLGEQGFVGLGLFFALIASCLFTLRKVIRTAKKNPKGRWALVTAHALEVGICAYLVSGATLGLANFDLWYLYVACTSILHVLYKQQIKSEVHAQIATEPPEDVESTAEEVSSRGGLYA